MKNSMNSLLGQSRATQENSALTVPKTFFKEEYRGKNVDIKITVKDIKWLKPAEINADFLKRFGVETEAELREQMRDHA